MASIIQKSQLDHHAKFSQNVDEILHFFEFSGWWLAAIFDFQILEI